jgi:hypothetical protein
MPSSQRSVLKTVAKLLLMIMLLSGCIVVIFSAFNYIRSEMLDWLTPGSSSGLNLFYEDSDRAMTSNYWMNTEAGIDPVPSAHPYRTAVDLWRDETEFAYQSIDGSQVPHNFHPFVDDAVPSYIIQLERVRIVSESCIITNISFWMEAKSDGYPVSVIMTPMLADGTPNPVGLEGTLNYPTVTEDIDNYHLIMVNATEEDPGITIDTVANPTTDYYYFVGIVFGSGSGGGYIFGCSLLETTPADDTEEGIPQVPIDIVAITTIVSTILASITGVIAVIDKARKDIQQQNAKIQAYKYSKGDLRWVKKGKS